MLTKLIFPWFGLVWFYPGPVLLLSSVFGSWQGKAGMEGKALYTQRGLLRKPSLLVAEAGEKTHRTSEVSLAYMDDTLWGVVRCSLQPAQCGWIPVSISLSCVIQNVSSEPACCLAYQGDTTNRKKKEIGEKANSQSNIGERTPNNPLLHLSQSYMSPSADWWQRRAALHCAYRRDSLPSWSNQFFSGPLRRV